MEDNVQLTELRRMAKERGLKNISKLKKNELIELLNNTEECEVQEDEDIIEDKEEFVSR